MNTNPNYMNTSESKQGSWVHLYSSIHEEAGDRMPCTLVLMRRIVRRIKSDDANFNKCLKSLNNVLTSIRLT